MNSEEKDNTRRFFRCDIQLPFTFSIIKGKEIVGPYSGRTLNLGGGGMYFATTCPLLQPGTLLLVEFLPPAEGEKLPEGVLPGDFMARVIREATGVCESTLERSYRLAVEFKFPHKATKNDIVAYLNRYESQRKNKS
ncbi:MAG: PilZ domain-containing protein [Deltaproteobacteria bacterium]|nr:PilZ domain-containing protein [Candidatus Tharpella aukensis]